MDSITYPGRKWEKKPPTSLGFSENVLKKVLERVKNQSQSKKFRIIISRSGFVAAEWQKGINVHVRLSLASAAKSLYSSILGVAIEEDMISSIDSKIVDIYPECMNIKEGEGPKPGRYAKPEDKNITFRQLISNMSGYMKPGETPDERFHYQTYGMNILSHAIAKAYGYYDSKYPKRHPGFRKLLDDKIKTHIDGAWKYKYFNFSHPRGAKTNVFGNYTVVEANARDMTRMGYLWLRLGNWNGNQIVPEHWLNEATKTAPNIKANCPESQWKYGYAFWVNEHGKMWPDLPRDSYAAIGAGGQHIWVCPSYDLVVVQSPGIISPHSNTTDNKFLELIIESLKK